MLTLTRKTDYALISLVHLGQTPESCSSAREIAEQYKMPLPLLMNVLKLLTQHGMIQSMRGPRGGYTLVRAPEDITLNDIIEAVEGPVHLVRCAMPAEEAAKPNGNGQPCDRTSICPVRSSIHRVHHRLIEFLDEFTLADMLSGSGSNRSGPYAKMPGGSVQAP